MRPTGFLYDPRFLDHDTGPGHPERKERLTHTLAHLEKLPLMASLEKIAPQAASLEWIETVHSPEYVARAKETCLSGERMLDTPDVAVSPASYEAALLAAGGALTLADKIMEGKIQNAFALLRPPGHHAEADFAMGFCLFNNAAILARYLQKKHGLERIFILDWDVHHGNGTQHTFEEDPSVFYASLHQYPFYPGTGASWETGEGRGRGTTLNCPMKAGSADAEYLEAFRTKITPAVEAFKPDAIILSAGFDAHARDPLGQVNLTTESYRWMTEEVMRVAGKYSDGRIISLLEGGYDLQALAGCTETHLKELMK